MQYAYIYILNQGKTFFGKFFLSRFFYASACKKQNFNINRVNTSWFMEGTASGGENVMCVSVPTECVCVSNKEPKACTAVGIQYKRISAFVLFTV